ncbi:MAG: DUF87 domain-containing protein [Lachnospiraceae bacterium]|nr:DUF87 domain-containing protein [Lachnospiraceae bacterium]
MRLIPGKTKVRIELFKGITLADIIVALLGIGIATLCIVSTIPGRIGIAIAIIAIFGLLLFRLDDEGLYVLIWHMLRYSSYSKNYKIKEIGEEEKENKLLQEEVAKVVKERTEEEDKVSEKEKKERLKELIKVENEILKSKTATEEEKDAVWQARAERAAEKKKEKVKKQDKTAKVEDIKNIVPFTAIKDGYVEYGGKYYGCAIEIDPIEFRFFSQHRRNNSIESCLGKVLRSFQGEYGANIVKVQRPIVYDSFLDAEYNKLSEIKKSYENGMFTEEELKARVEIQYDRINEVRRLCNEDKVIEPFYYLVLFDSSKSRLDLAVRQAINTLQLGELVVRRLDSRGLAKLLKYSNGLDFDESEADRIDEADLANWATPKDVKFYARKVEVNNFITHNLRVISYPTMVGDSWLAGVMSFPATKVVVKIVPMDNDKAIRAIDRSLSELRGQYIATSQDSKMLELSEHINTLSTLLLTLQQDNETLLSVNVYVTAYDASMTEQDPVLSEDFKSLMPYIADMKKTLKRSWSEAGMRLSGMDFMQVQGFIGSQISNYDPLLNDGRGIPTNTIAAMFPWIFAHISDEGGIKLGESDGVPVFIDFFKRDSERVNSNMVIVGKSGSGKSYATKALLANLASEDAKIFILDPENEYSELAHNLNGKVINVGNAKYGRLNPFHIITALEDDEAGEDGGGPGGSFATHLQFLEEFFKQILPDIDKDALEFLNSLIERVYLNFGITPETDLSALTAEDYPIFDDLYDVVLAEFERTNNEYLRKLLRSLVNYISKFSTGGRNANIWNGPSTITTEENFSVFNFQSMIANRNTTIANAQMLLVLKYVDNEIIKNRDYNLKYGLNRKVVVVIDEAHVFIDTKFPVALDFMFQLAKRIRKYNGMQIVITQNIKDFVGSEEIARKSSAIINACQYSFVFGLAPNDMSDLCKLYEKAGGINEREQEDIVGAKRGEAFTIMSPTSRSSFTIDVPHQMVEMFENRDFRSYYFSGEEGKSNWEDFVSGSREAHDINFEERKRAETKERVVNERQSIFSFSEITEDEAKEIQRSYEAEADGSYNDEKNSIKRMMEAEMAVDKKEYEMAMGRFGNIDFQEISDSEVNLQEEAADSKFGGISFSEVSDDDLEKLAKASEPTAQSANTANTANVDEHYINDTLNEFKESMREEMEKELIDKIKWIQLGAGINMAQPVAYGGMDPVNTGTMPYQTPQMQMPDSYDDNGFVDNNDYMPDNIAGMDYDLNDIGTLSDSDDSLDDEEMDEEDEFASLDDALGSLDNIDLDEDEFEDSDDNDDIFADIFDDDDEDEFEDDSDDDDDIFDFDEESDDEESEEESDDESDDFDDDLFDDDDDIFEVESEEYEPTPFVFSELLAETAEEYSHMDVSERMDEINEEVMEITLEELIAYVKKHRKKKVS